MDTEIDFNLLPEFHCRTCAFHSAGFCLKTYTTTADYETCDEYKFRGDYKKPEYNETY